MRKKYGFGVLALSCILACAVFAFGQGDPVVVQNDNCQSGTQMDSYCYFDVKNVSDHTVNGITATITYFDSNSKKLDSHMINVGSLDPGQTAAESDHWLNPASIYNVSHEITLQWQGKQSQN